MLISCYSNRSDKPHRSGVTPLPSNVMGAIGLRLHGSVRCPKNVGTRPTHPPPSPQSARSRWVRDPSHHPIGPTWFPFPWPARVYLHSFTPSKPHLDRQDMPVSEFLVKIDE